MERDQVKIEKKKTENRKYEVNYSLHKLHHKIS